MFLNFRMALRAALFVPSLRHPGFIIYQFMQNRQSATKDRCLRSLSIHDVKLVHPLSTSIQIFLHFCHLSLETPKQLLQEFEALILS